MTLDELVFLSKEDKKEFTEKGGRIFNTNSYRLPNGEVDLEKMAKDMVEETIKKFLTLSPCDRLM